MMVTQSMYENLLNKFTRKLGRGIRNTLERRIRILHKEAEKFDNLTQQRMIGKNRSIYKKEKVDITEKMIDIFPRGFIHMLNNYRVRPGSYEFEFLARNYGNLFFDAFEYFGLGSSVARSFGYNSYYVDPSHAKLEMIPQNRIFNDAVKIYEHALNSSIKEEHISPPADYYLLFDDCWTGIKYGRKKMRAVLMRIKVK